VYAVCCWLDVSLQLLLSGVTCSFNRAVVHGGCMSVLRAQQVVVAGSNFTYNTVRADCSSMVGSIRQWLRQ
jgi:hypothetical protein